MGNHERNSSMGDHERTFEHKVLARNLDHNRVGSVTGLRDERQKSRGSRHGLSITQEKPAISRAFYGSSGSDEVALPPTEANRLTPESIRL